MKKVCPRCGATFDCMHNDILSCHCATVRLDAGSPDKPGGLSIQLCKSEKKEFYIRYSS